MSIREIPGFLDHKNALNIAQWRLRNALQQGRDLVDLRSDAQLHIASWVSDNSMPHLDWETLDKPTCKRVRRRKKKSVTPALCRRQAA